MFFFAFTIFYYIGVFSPERGAYRTEYADSVAFGGSASPSARLRYKNGTMAGAGGHAEKARNKTPEIILWATGNVFLSLREGKSGCLFIFINFYYKAFFPPSAAHP